MPQTKLLGSTYITYNLGMKNCLESVFDNNLASEYNDLAKIFKEKTDTIFCLTYNQLEGLNYFSEQGFPFLRQLHGIRQKMYLEVRPNSEHAVIYNISETLTLFEKYTDFSIDANTNTQPSLSNQIIFEKGNGFRHSQQIRLSDKMNWSDWLNVKGLSTVSLSIRLRSDSDLKKLALFSIDFDNPPSYADSLYKSPDPEIGYFNYLNKSGENKYDFAIPANCTKIRIGLRCWASSDCFIQNIQLS